MENNTGPHYYEKQPAPIGRRTILFSRPSLLSLDSSLSLSNRPEFTISTVSVFRSPLCPSSQATSPPRPLSPSLRLHAWPSVLRHRYPRPSITSRFACGADFGAGTARHVRHLRVSVQQCKGLKNESTAIGDPRDC
ncbi:hypothetical protein CRG98_011072 [Punica granatum]|uniref:Uncharacterized protein n=1 Tax=Punica granatum TaxID=22663 RepID=A0A2I0KJZ1_PUNGR|nr:hypothetical protein CRG98_011072 [Punica granatum]